MTLTHQEIIRGPVVSEKSTWSGTERNAYVFEVDKRADKTQIKEAVEALFNVKVLDVRTIRMPGKPRRTRAGYATTGEWKKAIVKLHPDNKIDLF